MEWSLVPSCCYPSFIHFPFPHVILLPSSVSCLMSSSPPSLPVGFLCWCHVGFQSECCHLTCLVLPWRPWLVSWWTSMAVVVWTSVWDIYFCGIHFLFIFIHHGQTLSSRSETHWMFYTPLKGEKRAIWRRAELDRGCVWVYVRLLWASVSADRRKRCSSVCVGVPLCEGERNIYS